MAGSPVRFKALNHQVAEKRWWTRRIDANFSAPVTTAWQFIGWMSREKQNNISPCLHEEVDKYRTVSHKQSGLTGLILNSISSLANNNASSRFGCQLWTWQEKSKKWMQFLVLGFISIHDLYLNIFRSPQKHFITLELGDKFEHCRIFDQIPSLM